MTDSADHIVPPGMKTTARHFTIISIARADGNYHDLISIRRHLTPAFRQMGMWILSINEQTEKDWDSIPPDDSNPHERSDY